jgi:hypothetical protein
MSIRSVRSERFALTARTKIADRMLTFGERHLRMTLAQYERHHNGRRLYRGRQLCLPGPITLRPASPGSGSKAPSAALSRGMSGPHREAQVRNDSRVLKTPRAYGQPATAI